MPSRFFTFFFRRSLFVLLFLCLSVGTAQTTSGVYHPGTKRVLLIHSYNIWHAQSYNLLPGFLKVMSFFKTPYTLEHLELNGQWDTDPASWQEKLELYLPALQNGHYSTVITFNAIAGELLQKNHSCLYPGTSVIFCAPEHWDASLRKYHPNQTAIFSNPEITENIYLCMRLFPRTRQIILLLDNSRESQKILQSLPDVSSLSPDAKLIPLNPSTISDTVLLEYLADLDQHSVVLYYGWSSQPESASPVPADFFSEICSSSTVPVMVMREALLSYNVVGGFIASEEETGRRTANILCSLFQGGHLSLVPPERIQNQIILNWPQLKKHNITPARIPGNALLRNQPPSPWAARQQAITRFGCILTLSLLFIVAGILILSRRRQSMRRYDVISTHLPVRYFVADADGNILLSGLGNRELLDKRKYDIQHINDLHDIDLDMLMRTIRETIHTGQPTSFNFSFRDSWRTASFSKLPTHLFKREAVIWVSQNTTELQQSRREAQDNAERFLQTLKSIGDAVIVTDHNGKITIMNNVASSLTGWREEDSLGKPLQEIFNIISHKDDKPIPSPVDEVLHTRKIVELAAHTDLISRNGERHHIADSAAPIFDDKGNVTGTVLVFRDVTEQYQQREKREQLELEQKKLIAQLNNYVESERLLNNCLSQIVVEADFNHNIERIFSALTQQFGCDRISIGHFDNETRIFKLDHCWTAAELQETWNQEAKPIHAFYPYVQDRFEQDLLLSIPDCTQAPFPDIPQKTAVKSLIAAPIMVQGVLWRVLTIAFLREQKVFSEIDENIVRSSCKIIALAHIQNKQHAALCQTDLEKKLILNNIQIPIWLYDADGTLLRVNTAVSRYFGIQEILALEQAENVLFDESVPPSLRPLNQVILTGKPASRETRVNHFDFLVTAEPVIDVDGKLINIVECAVNITDINEGMRQQEMAMKAALEADRTKSFFLATMSHEIRTPLNVVIGYSELLQKKQLDDREQKEYLQSIHCAGNALLQLINDILDLSKIEASQMQIVVAKTDFTALCKEICSLFQLPSEQKGLSIKQQLSSMPYLFVDQLRLRQVLLNLMGNAVKFTERGSITLEAHFTRDNESAGTLEFSVSDTGPGISPENQEKLFTPFVQFATSRYNEGLPPGTGLGLSISSRLVKKMGGDISVASTLGVGSRFTVSIPNVAYSIEQEEAYQPPEISVVIPDKHDLSFLIIDDVPMNLKVLSAMLNKCHVRTTAVTSAAQALEALEQDSFDLILTDIWMPQMTGVEFAAAVKENDRHQDIPIIAVTADIENHQNFCMQNFAGVILKPLTLKKIASLVESLRNQQIYPSDPTSG
jgi:PAS domain S-box-containing protein